MALKIDRSTPFGERVLRRLTEDWIGWLTTVGKDGTPHPRPVWFWWDGDSILIYSQPDTAKLAHIARNGRVSLNLNGDPSGGDIVVLTGRAAIDRTAPAANAIPAYVEKYAHLIERIKMTPEGFAAAYSVPIRFHPEKVSGH